MTTIKEFIEQTIVLPSETLNLSRSVMPQIPRDGYDDFLKFLKENGISYKRKTVPLLSLKASQGQFDVKKIKERIGQNITKDSPLLVSNDSYILDGHHRWLADINSGRKDVAVICIDLPIMKLIELAKDHDGIHYRDINDKKKSVVETVKTVVFRKNK